MALLSVAAVAVVLGGTVAGVKMMGSSGQVPAAGQSPSGAAPVPQSTNTDESEEPVEDEPTEEDSATPTESARPSPTNTVRQPRRTTSPRPTPTRTKAKHTTKPTDDAEPTDEATETDAPTEGPTTVSEPSTGVFPTDTGAPVPDPTSSVGYQSRSGGSVNVKWDVVDQAISGYKAAIDVTNSSMKTMSGLTLSLPVTGRVIDVRGADWTQDGQLLIIDVTQALASGDSANLTFTATGKATQPENCGMVGGECAVD